MRLRMLIYFNALCFNAWLPGNLGRSHENVEIFGKLARLVTALHSCKGTYRLVRALLQACYSIAFLQGLSQACMQGYNKPCKIARL